MPDNLNDPGDDEQTMRWLMIIARSHFPGKMVTCQVEASHADVLGQERVKSPQERQIWKRISRPRNPSSGWILIRKSKSELHEFSFYRSIGKSEKDLQNCSREQRSSFWQLCVHVQDRRS